MANWSGNGSSMVVGVTTLHARLTRVRKGARLTENTHSGTSSSNYDKVVPDHSWSGSIPWDDANLPDTDVGLTEGSKVTIVFALGASGKSETLTNTTVEFLEDIMDNQGDIIRTEVSGRGGVLTRPVT
jgi:uncharacterized protein YndB with AHSA1/START domain